MLEMVPLGKHCMEADAVCLGVEEVPNLLGNVCADLRLQTVVDIDRVWRAMFAQQQTGASDCGLFAIATATALCFGIPPSTTLWANQPCEGIF